MTSPIETNNVVERLRADADFLDLIPGIHPSRAARVRDAADEIERLRSENQSLSDRIDVLEDAVRVSAQAFRTLEEVAVAQLEHDKARNFIKLGDRCRASLTQGGKNG